MSLFNLSRLFKEYDYRLWILAFGWMVSAMGFAMIIPFISIYFYQELKIPMSIVGAVFGIASLGRALFGVIGGEVSDRLGRVKVMGYAQILRGIAFLVVSWIISRGGGFLPIALLVVFSSLLGGFFQPVAHAMVADVVGKEKRVEGFSIVRIGGNLGWAIGPAIGGFVSAVSYSLLFLIAAFFTFVSSSLILSFIKETLPKNEGLTKFKFKDLLEIRKDRLFFIYCGITLVLFIVVAQLVATFSVYSVDWVGISKNQLGLLYTLNGLIVVFFQFPTSKLIGKYKLTRVLFLGSLIYMVGYSSVGFANSFFWLFLSMGVITLAEIVVMPASMAIVANMSKESHYGRYMGTFGLFNSFAWSLGPFIGGVLLDVLAEKPVFIWLGISILALFSSFGYKWLGSKLPESFNLQSKV